MVGQLISHRGLLMSLVRRQYLLRYRQSFIGFAWALLPALATMVMATLVFDTIAEVDTGGAPYPLFALAGLAPWTLFASAMTQGVPSVVQSSTMITRLAFPRIVLPLSMLGTALFYLAITTVVFAVFVLASGGTIPITAFWFFPLVLIELILATGVVLLTSSLNVFARDIKLAVPLITQLWLFLTPVMYPLSEMPPTLQRWMIFNPMTGLMESFRTVLLTPGAPPELSVLFPSLIGALVFIVIGWWYFGTVEKRFADVV